MESYLYQTPVLYEMQESTKSEVFWKFNKLQPGARKNLYNIEGVGLNNRLWCTFLPTTEKENNFLGRALVPNIYWVGADMEFKKLNKNSLENHINFIIKTD